MQAQSPLDLLADIHLPDSVSIWPLAPIYWIVLAFLVLGVISYILIKRKQKQNFYRRQFKQLLDQSFQNHATLQDKSQLLQASLEILKRTAKHLHAPDLILSAPNEVFVRWLKVASPTSSSFLTAQVEQLFVSGIYQKEPEGDIQAVYHFAQHWLTHHSPKHIKIANQAEVNHV